jgi:iron complex transport system permease protein
MRDMSGKVAYIRFIFIFLSFLLIAMFLIDLLSGSVHIDLSEAFGSLLLGKTNDNGLILTQFRLPKAITAVIAGAAIACSGLVMQTVFRNPLAGPDVLGVSSGAGLGVALMILTVTPFIHTGNASWLQGWGLILAAWIGAGGVMFLIMTVSSRMRDIMTVLIIGILIASAISSVVSVMQYFSNETMLKTYVVWTMGNIGNLSPSQVKVLAISSAAGLLLALLEIKPLNAILMGETFARTVGVNIKLSRILIFASASILAGSVTAFCGPVAFIGIAVPHIARLLTGSSDHRILLPASLLTGSITLLISDIISNIPISGSVLPINTVTSLIGIPVILWIIIGKKGIKKTF